MTDVKDPGQMKSWLNFKLIYYNMHPRLYIFLIMLAFCFPAKGQHLCVDSTYGNTYKVVGAEISISVVLNTNDQGSLLVGGITSDELTRGLLIKLSSAGKVQWSRIITDNDSNPFFFMTSVIQLKNNNYAVTVSSGQAKNRKIAVVKLSESGDRIWEKTLRNNYGTSIFDPSFLINNINEGKDGDLILNTYEGDDGYLKNGPGITRLNHDGNVVWSIQYFGNIRINVHNSNIFQNGELTFWGQVYETQSYGTPCDGSRGFLNSITLNYNTANIEKVMRYCISAENENITVSPDLQTNSFNRRFFSSKGLANGETAVFLEFRGGNNNMLFIKFDHELNFKSAYQIVPFVENPFYTFFSSGINENDGRLIMGVRESTNTVEGAKPYHIQIHINKDAKIQSQFYFGNNRSISFLQFQRDNRINEIENKNGTVTVNNVSAEPDASSFCQQATDTTFGYIQDYKLIQSNSNYQWEDIRRNVYTAVSSSDVIAMPVQVEQLQECKIVSFCDSLKITGENNFCIGKDETTQLKINRNSECNKDINWSLDSSYADLNKKINDTTVEISFKKPGTFKVYAGLNGCILKDSINITVNEAKQVFSVMKDDDLCPGKPLTLSATKDFVKYSWSDGSDNDNLTIHQPGKYSVAAQDACGNIFSDSISIKQIDTAFTSGNNFSICLNDTLKIQLPQSIREISWSSAAKGLVKDHTLSLFPQNTNTFVLKTFFSKNCFTEKTIKVIVNNCPETIHFPNAFSPNGDGLNDIFKPTLGKYLLSYRLSIFNRYGQKVFETTDPETGWYGRFRSESAESGIYAWTCDYQFPGKERKSIKGQILLIR